MARFIVAKYLRMTRFSPSAKIKLNFDAPIYFFSSNERPCDKKKGRNRRTRVRVNFRPSLLLSFPNVRPATARSNLSLSTRNAHVRLITEKGIVAGVWPAAWPSLWIATLWGSEAERNVCACIFLFFCWISTWTGLYYSTSLIFTIKSRWTPVS